MIYNTKVFYIAQYKKWRASAVTFEVALVVAVTPYACWIWKTAFDPHHIAPSQLTILQEVAQVGEQLLKCHGGCFARSVCTTNGTIFKSKPSSCIPTMYSQ